MVRVALAHDYLTQRGGGERVVLEFAAAFPDAPIYTSLYEPSETFPEFAELDVRPSPLNQIGFLRRHHRAAFPLLAPAFSRMQADADVVICSSTGWAHGIKASGKKIVYCHNPARWLYQTDEYVPNIAKAASPILTPFLALLRRWDARAAHSADLYLANSKNVTDRIQATYGISTEICHPSSGISAKKDGPGVRPQGVKDKFLLCVCRLLGYKNVGAVIEGARAVDGTQLVIVGAGPDRDELCRQAAGSDTLFLQDLDDDGLRYLYTNCLAAISASHEDFGLMPVEAAMFGRPSVVLRKGGFIETVIEGTTGEFFDLPTSDAIEHAIMRADTRRWDQAAISAHAARFSRASFHARMRDAVDRVLAD